MRNRAALFVSFLALVFALTASRQASAQAPEPLQLGVGYHLVHVSFDGAGETFPIGLYTDLGRTLKSDDKKAWGWMGQFEAGFHRGDGFSDQLYTFLGGIRVASSKPLKWTPSGYGLIGAGMLNASCDKFCIGTKKGVAFQGGVALTTRVNEKVAAVAAFKVTKIKFQSGSRFNTAVTGGLRISL